MPNLADFAIPLATSLPFLAAILSLLPSIARNVKFAETANRLECGIREENALFTKCKSGKNGNVDHPSQHCHTRLRPPLSPQGEGLGVRNLSPRRRTSRPLGPPGAISIAGRPARQRPSQTCSCYGLLFRIPQVRNREPVAA